MAIFRYHICTTNQRHTWLFFGTKFVPKISYFKGEMRLFFGTTFVPQISYFKGTHGFFMVPNSYQKSAILKAKCGYVCPIVAKIRSPVPGSWGDPPPRKGGPPVLGTGPYVHIYIYNKKCKPATTGAGNGQLEATICRQSAPQKRTDTSGSKQIHMRRECNIGHKIVDWRPIFY